MGGEVPTDQRMSAIDGSERQTTVELEELPDFELSYLFDDSDEPAEVTVFPVSNAFDISTNWITIDADSAIPLEHTR